MNKFLFLVAVAVLALRPTAWATGENNPTGVAGSFNGEIHTAGTGSGVDPLTGNGKRGPIEDLSVTGAVGSYPLLWSRNLTTRNSGASGPFGPAGWRHSYQWGLWLRFSTGTVDDRDYEGTNGQVAFPDGRVINLTKNNGVWIPEAITLSDMGMIKVVNVGTGLYDLFLSDGGIVHFQAAPPFGTVVSPRATSISDPNGLVTTFTYDSSGRLARVTEPAGRYLQINYSSFYVNNAYQYLITSVQGFNSSAGPSQTVTYSYSSLNYNNPPGSGARGPSYYLTQVNYEDGAQAHYTYQKSNYQGDTYGFGVIKTCDDPRFSGPMKSIEFEFAWRANNPALGLGQVTALRNATTHQIVTQITYPSYPLTNANATLEAGYWARTETRGDGAARTFQYNGHLVSISPYLISYTDFQGHSSQVAESYGPNVYTESFTDARQHTSTTERNGVFRVTKVTHPDNSFASYTYTSDGLYLLTATDENNHTTTYTRDPVHHWITDITYPDWSAEHFTYNGFGQVLTHTLPGGGVETSQYDARGLKTLSYPPATWSDPSPASHPTLYYYYTSGPHTDRLLYSQDPRGNATWYEYNLRGQVTKLTHQDGTYTQSSYNADGTLAWSADENHPGAATDPNQRTRYTYDEYKRVLTVTSPMNETTTYGYAQDWANPFVQTTANPKFVQSPMGKLTHYAYDGDWHKTIMRQAPTTADDAWTYYGYDAVGNLTSVQDPRGNMTSYGYDNRDRKISQTDPAPFNNQITQWQYDYCNNKTRETRPDGSFRTWDYDSRNRLYHAYDWRTNDPPTANQTVSYLRDDPARNLTRIIDQKGATYSYTYDELGRKYIATYPADATGQARSEYWHHDFSGNLDAYQNRAGKLQHLSYDNRNRNYSSFWDGASWNVPDWTVGPEITTSFDSASRVTQIRTNNNATTISYGYDNANRQIWEEQTVAGSPTHRLEAECNPDGLRRYLHFPGWFLVFYDYTQRSQLWHILDNTGATPLVTYSYDAAANMTKRQTNYGGLNDSVNIPSAKYDALDRPTMWENTGSGDYPFARLWYQYDSVSRETVRWRDEDAGRGERFDYSPTNQVTKAIYNAQYPWTPTPSNWTDNDSYTYTPDNLNRSSVNHNGTATGYVANTMNQYTSAGSQSPGYDANFNLTSYGGATYTYNAANQLLSASKGGNTMQCVYDGVGRCLKRTINGVVIIYSYDGWKPVMEWDGSGNLRASNIYGPGADELIVRNQTGVGPLHYHTDREGNVTFLLDMNGAGAERYTYNAFGAPKITDWSTTVPRAQSVYGNRYMFTGREYFPEFGIYDYRNRYYQPELGRFLQSDPIGFDAGDMNLFRYCADDPVDRTDPTGLFVSQWDKLMLWQGSGDGSVSEQIAKLDQAAGVTGPPGNGHVRIERIRVVNEEFDRARHDSQDATVVDDEHYADRGGSDAGAPGLTTAHSFVSNNATVRSVIFSQYGTFFTDPKTGQEKRYSSAWRDKSKDGELDHQNEIREKINPRSLQGLADRAYANGGINGLRDAMRKATSAAVRNSSLRHDGSNGDHTLRIDRFGTLRPYDE